MKEIEKSFGKILERERQRLGSKNVEFVNSKFRYELEVEDKVVKGNKKPEEYQFTSSRQGYQRFHTNEIIEKIAEIEEVEEKVKNYLQQFCIFVFE